MLQKIILICCVLNVSVLMAQSGEIYKEISGFPAETSDQTVLARLIESLGFRYYWATEGLTENDLSYQISDESRSMLDTMEHIYDLSIIIKNAALKQPNESLKEELTYQLLRDKTLENFKIAENAILKTKSLEDVVLVFGESNIPFWNLINGPVTDAVWHCGQISSFRRASGNPINSKINFFNGKVRD